MVNGKELWQSLLDESTHLTYLRDTAQVAFHVSHKTRYTSLTESLGHHLQRHRLACSRSSGYESVTIRHLTCYRKRSIGAMGYVQPPFFIVHNG